MKANIYIDMQEDGREVEVRFSCESLLDEQLLYFRLDDNEGLQTVNGKTAQWRDDRMLEMILATVSNLGMMAEAKGLTGNPAKF